jgi:hypothetical protein
MKFYIHDKGIKYGKGDSFKNISHEISYQKICKQGAILKEIYK